MRSYYLAQHITAFKGRKYSQNENYAAAFDYAQQVVLWAANNGIILYSPAAYTVHLANAWHSDESPPWRKIYKIIDDQFVLLSRNAGILIWIFPENWMSSLGCRIEMLDCITHNEKAIKFDPFYLKMMEEDIMTIAERAEFVKRMADPNADWPH